MLEQAQQALPTNLTFFGVSLLAITTGLVVWLLRTKRREAWPLLGLLSLFLFNCIFSSNFMTITVREGTLFGTPINLLNQGSVVSLLAIGMSLVIAVKGIDLSVGSVMALSGGIAVVLMKSAGLSFAAAGCIALFASVLVGLFNGALVTGLGVQPIVATLMTMVGVRGVAMLVTGAEPITHDDSVFAFIGTGHFLGLPFSFGIVAIVLLATIVATRRTALGLFIESIGDNEAASRIAGVPTRPITLLLYGFCALCAGVAGLIAASYIATADPDRIGRMSELDAIFAAVVGGTALTGGRFFPTGAVLGGLLIQTLSVTMYNQDVPAETEPMPKAVVILLVCLLLSQESRQLLLDWWKRKMKRWQAA
jgi:simple sugar transport system permease protein